MSETLPEEEVSTVNYANDPFWAHKDWYGPEQLQAYELQVMADRAAAERHRAELDVVAVAAGALGLGLWLSGAEERSRSRARRRYIQANCPEDYTSRKAAFERALVLLEDHHQRTVARLGQEIAIAERRLRGATAKRRVAHQARVEGLEAELRSEGAIYAQDQAEVLAEYADVLAYESGLASIV